MFTFLETHTLLRIIRNRKSEQTDNVYISPGLSKFLAISFMELYIQFLCQICEVLSYYFAKFNSPPSFSLLVDKLFLYPFFLSYLIALMGLLELKKKKKILVLSSSPVSSLNFYPPCHQFFLWSELSYFSKQSNAFFIWFTEFFSSRVSIFFFLQFGKELLCEFLS